MLWCSKVEDVIRAVLDVCGDSEKLQTAARCGRGYRDHAFRRHQMTLRPSYARLSVGEVVSRTRLYPK